MTSSWLDSLPVARRIFSLLMRVFSLPFLLTSVMLLEVSRGGGGGGVCGGGGGSVCGDGGVGGGGREVASSASSAVARRIISLLMRAFSLLFLLTSVKYITCLFLFVLRGIVAVVVSKTKDAASEIHCVRDLSSVIACSCVTAEVRERVEAGRRLRVAVR